MVGVNEYTCRVVGVVDISREVAVVWACVEKATGTCIHRCTLYIGDGTEYKTDKYGRTDLTVVD